jgi:molybdate-binding protein
MSVRDRQVRGTNIPHLTLLRSDQLILNQITSQSTAEAPIILALQAYQADLKLSLRRAAKLYDVHFQTLHY